MKQNETSAPRKLTITLDADLDQRLQIERARIEHEAGLPHVALNSVIVRTLRAGLAAGAASIGQQTIAPVETNNLPAWAKSPRT